jgi:hypothetical protein
VSETSRCTPWLGEKEREINLYRIEPGHSRFLTTSCILGELPFPFFAVREKPVEGVVIRPADVTVGSRSYRNGVPMSSGLLQCVLRMS